ncbi:uncharacterized protein LOC136071161 [Quercus suber]|uniref:uncharacterized protein LOC136071161 n=1 Tax=Quercus suber TaxID=58331 RepID=UPI0032DF7834
MWKSNCIISVLEYNKNLIAVKVSDPVSDWVLVGFYGPSYASKKAKAWMNLSAFLESVQCPWETNLHRQKGSYFTKLCKKQEATRKALRKWNKEVFGLCQTRINLLIHKIAEIQRDESSDWNGNTEASLQAELREWRRHNNIDAIRGDDGDWITDSCLIRQHLQEKFKNLFTAEDVNFPAQMEDLISTVISEEENIALCRIPTPEEIKSTLFHMPELKAPGPDGFPVAFYKSYWPIVGRT